MNPRNLPGPFVFDAARDAWVLAPPRADAVVPDEPVPPRVSLATWNVWFGEYEPDLRRAALLAILGARAPDVICLQEVTDDFLAALRAAAWVRAAYALSDATGESFDDYGVVLLARRPLARLALAPLPSSMGRALLTGAVGLGDRELVVGTVHLESGSHNADTRGDQLAEVFPRLTSLGEDCVLAGDFNFCAAHRQENARLDRAFVDVWPAVRGGAPGYTEDTDVNVMRRNVTGQETQVRFDRVLLRSARGRLRPAAIELLGTAPVSPSRPDVFPSDHFGLLATFALATPGA